MHRPHGFVHWPVRQVQRFWVQRIAPLETMDVDLGIHCVHSRIGVGVLQLRFDSLGRLLG